MASMLFAKRTSYDELAKQSGVLFALEDGSLATLVPVRDPVYKRLQLLERQLQRHGVAPCALNARAFRTVYNGTVSRALTRGILDGALLARFVGLHALREHELAKAINSDPETIQLNLLNARAPW